MRAYGKAFARCPIHGNHWPGKGGFRLRCEVAAQLDRVVEKSRARAKAKRECREGLEDLRDYRLDDLIERELSDLPPELGGEAHLAGFLQ